MIHIYMMMQKFGQDTVIRPKTVIKSGVKIGRDCIIGYNVYISENTIIENGRGIEDNTIL